MRGLAGKVVVITGAGGGIGRALVRRFAEEGAVIAALDMNGEAAKAAAGDAETQGARAIALTLDITDHAAVAAAAAQVGETLGGADILVNNAGWDIARPFVDTDLELWQKIIAINLMGPLNVHHAFLPGMIARGQGRIVNIASDAARVGSSGESVYAACKGGIVAFTKTIAREHARHRICANAVCPGPTDTPLFRSFLGEGDYGQKLYQSLERSIPLRRLGQPDDMPGIVAFLASDDAGYITGQVISVSGGLTMVG